MFESRHRSGGGSSANRWLLVAGAGLVILAFVARMLLDIGHTRVTDLAAAMRPDTTARAEATTPDSAVTPGPTGTDSSPATATPPGTAVVPATPPVFQPDTTASPAPGPVPPAPAPADRLGTYAVQIGAFGSEANATKLGARASALGYTAQVVPPERGGSTLYFVRVTELSGASEARLAADSLARTLGVKSVVVPPGR